LTACKRTSVLAATGLLSTTQCESNRFVFVPADCEPQIYKPAAPYPRWDTNWDYRKPTVESVTTALGHDKATPIKTRCSMLLEEHTKKSEDEIEMMLRKDATELEELYVTWYLRYAHGGAATRHIILVRHGQYDEAYNKEPLCKGETVRHDPHDCKRVLTELGRKQATATGVRLAEMLDAALSTPGREGHVRLLCSSSARAGETADFIQRQLPPHVPRLPPDANLKEGFPAHRIPTANMYPGEAEAVHVEGGRIEAAFRQYFYRSDPLERKTLQHAPSEAKDEYDIIVCHGNVIRYFMLRAMQLPPEAWLRAAPFNCSITHLVVRPSGNVSLYSFADTGHLPMDETTFSMHQGYEW